MRPALSLIHIYPADVRAAQIRLFPMRAGEHGVAEIGFTQICLFEVAVLQKSVFQLNAP